MKRSEIYLKAAELCHDKNVIIWNDTTFGYCDRVIGQVSKYKQYPELDYDESENYKEVRSYLSTDSDRDFILLFASELAKDTNN